MRKCIQWSLMLWVLLPNLAGAQTHLIDTSIRGVKWDSLLAHDRAHFEYDSDETIFQFKMSHLFDEESKKPDRPFTPDLKGDRVYRVITGDSTNDAYGSLSNVDYLDLNRDGQEDAALILWGGGNGAFASYVIFLQSASGPKFKTYGSGGYFQDSIEGDTLVILTCRYKDMNGATTWDVRQVVGDGDSIRVISSIETDDEGLGGDPNTQIAVDRFYEALNVKNFKGAYSMLSTRYRSAHPFKTWLKGFSTMESVQNEEQDLSSGSVVRVSIVSKDKIGGKLVERRFAGKWRLLWDLKEESWFLDRPEIHEVK